jgi:hypothetical protein
MEGSRRGEGRRRKKEKGKKERKQVVGREGGEERKSIPSLLSWGDTLCAVVSVKEVL